MKASRILALVGGFVLVLSLSSVAAIADPGNGNGGGKPSPEPSPSPTVTAEPTPEPSPAEAPWRSPDPSEAPATSGGSGGGGSNDASGGGGGNGPGTQGGGGGSGIVKLDRRPFDQAPNNEPHVGCTFQMDFYNYPEGVTAKYAFTLWPPTGHVELMSGGIQLENDPAGGGLDLDGEETVQLGPALVASGAEPHQHNGWHVKVVVNARHTSGPDQKQKVFWVRECQAAPTTTPTEPPTIEPSTVTPPGPVAFTGSNIVQMIGLMLLLLVLGTATMRIGRRLENS
jgi:hypothetical protein